VRLALSAAAVAARACATEAWASATASDCDSVASSRCRLSAPPPRGIAWVGDDESPPLPP
jgi:hypothetical protein